MYESLFQLFMIRMPVFRRSWVGQNSPEPQIPEFFLGARPSRALAKPSRVRQLLKLCRRDAETNGRDARAPQSQRSHAGRLPVNFRSSITKPFELGRHPIL